MAIKTQLNIKARLLNALLDRPAQPTTDGQPNPGHIMVSYNRHHGGYALREIASNGVESVTVLNRTWNKRVSGASLNTYLQGVIDALVFVGGK